MKQQLAINIIAVIGVFLAIMVVFWSYVKYKKNLQSKQHVSQSKEEGLIQDLVKSYSKDLMKVGYDYVGQIINGLVDKDHMSWNLDVPLKVITCDDFRELSAQDKREIKLIQVEELLLALAKINVHPISTFELIENTSIDNTSEGKRAPIVLWGQQVRERDKELILNNEKYPFAKGVILDANSEQMKKWLSRGIGKNKLLIFGIIESKENEPIKIYAYAVFSEFLKK